MAQYKPTAARKVYQLVDFPRTYFEVQNVRPAEGQYDVSVMAIWSLVPRDLNGIILKFLSGKELIGFKSVSKRTKSAAKSEKGKIFETI
jgi:hypothetical protein